MAGQLTRGFAAHPVAHGIELKGCNAFGQDAPAVREKPVAKSPAKLVQAAKSAAKRYLSRGNAAIKADDWAEF